jgi:hypothetical protein
VPPAACGRLSLAANAIDVMPLRVPAIREFVAIG